MRWLATIGALLVAAGTVMALLGLGQLSTDLADTSPAHWLGQQAGIRWRRLLIRLGFVKATVHGVSA